LHYRSIKGLEERQVGDPWGVPSGWVRRFAHLVASGGAVLDLAAGGGRHARFFRDRGHGVTAVDRNLDGMAGVEGIELIQADLEAAPWPLAGRRFAGVVVTNYLHRPLLPHLAGALEPEGGVLIYETFAVGHAEFGRPSSPDFLLRPNELLAAFTPGLTIIGYEHGIAYTPNPAAVQRIAAVAGRDLVPL
jgi:SAM-dependent methyltransferase